MVKIASKILRFTKVNYPRRLLRLASHFLFIEYKYRLKSPSIIYRVTDAGFYILDVLCIPDLWELISILIDPSIRLLDSEERQSVTDYFGSAIDKSYVKINNRMSSSIRKRAVAYVSFNTINYQKILSKAIFIHELVHVYQYQMYGSMYIFRALMAQRSNEGYAYGNFEGLYASMLSQKRLSDFNFEQQGAIMEDYCRIMEDRDLQLSPIVIATYTYFCEPIKDIK